MESSRSDPFKALRNTPIIATYVYRNTADLVLRFIRRLSLATSA